MNKTSNFSIENALRLHNLMTLQMNLFYAGIYTTTRTSMYARHLEIYPEDIKQLREAYELVKETRVQYEKLKFARGKMPDNRRYYTISIYF